MLDRESACNRVFLARRLFCSAPMELGFGSSPTAPRSTMSSPLLYAARSRPAPRSMITSERDIVGHAGNAMEPSQNSSMISRAHVHARARKAGRDQGLFFLIIRCLWNNFLFQNKMAEGGFAVGVALAAK